MKTLITILVLLLAGCSSTSTPGVHVWWNPSTWGSNKAATVQKIEANQSDNQIKLNKQAQREVHKTGQALKRAPLNDRAVQIAGRTNDNAQALLSEANGPEPIGDITDDTQIINDLISDNLQLRADGEVAQSKAEKVQAGLSAENNQLRSQLSTAQKTLEDRYVVERELANKVRNFWFILAGTAFLFIAGNLLSIAARFAPGLAGVARIVSGISAPALAFAEARATNGLQKVGQAISAARAEIPDLTNKVVAFLDDKLDTDHKQTISSAANIAPRT